MSGVLTSDRTPRAPLRSADRCGHPRRRRRPTEKRARVVPIARDRRRLRGRRDPTAQIDQDIVDFVKQNKEYFSEHPEIKLSYIENIIGKRIKTNPQKILKNLIQMNILNLVPLTGEFKKELLKRKMIKDYLDML